jgi:ribosomal-protein-alanine N-acetyltransferase
MINDMQAEFTVLAMTEAQLDGVAHLEQLCFPHEPWSADSLSVLCRENGIAYVTREQDGTISAYVGMQYAADEGSITNVATHPDYRRRGCAGAVLTALLAFAKEHDIQSVFLEVRPSNAAAIALYTHYGFEVVGRRKNFYRTPTEDALIMRATPQ